MPVVSVVVHPSGLHPIEAVKAWHKHTEEGMSLDTILEEGGILNMQGDVAGRYAVWSGIKRVAAMSSLDVLPGTNYGNCGRSKAVTEDEERAVIAFVKAWRHKRFCTCRYIKHELKLTAACRTISRVINEHGYTWRQVPKTQGLTKEQLAQRKVFVDKYLNRSAAWWEANLNMVLDGVTLTMPPKPLSGRQKHAAQRITNMWMCDGETFDNDLHTHNRYGVQMGTKVALWGGFTGNGKFTLRLWTPKPKMSNDDWAALVPDVKNAVDNAYGHDIPPRPKVWHDNERFLLCPEVYKENGLTLCRFPPNSGDLNPIETVWAWLRRALAEREQDDLEANRVLTPQQFKQRCAQILRSFEEPEAGKGPLSRIQKLIKGMPRRLASSKANSYGRCGK